MTVSLTTVGNSKAVIIPAKILKRLKITENSVLELVVDEKSGMVSLRKSGVKRDVVFPKVQIPEISEGEMQEFMNTLFRVPEEDMASDERLQYILSK